MEQLKVEGEYIPGKFKFKGCAVFTSDVVIDGNLDVFDLIAKKSIYIKGNCTIRRDGVVEGDFNVDKHLKVGNDLTIYGEMTVIGKIKITGRRIEK